MTAARESGEYDAFGNRTSPFDTEPPPGWNHPTPLCAALTCPSCMGHKRRVTVAGAWVACDTCDGTGGVTGRQLMEWHQHQEGR